MTATRSATNIHYVSEVSFTSKNTSTGEGEGGEVKELPRTSVKAHIPAEYLKKPQTNHNRNTKNPLSFNGSGVWERAPALVTHPEDRKPDPDRQRLAAAVRRGPAARRAPSAALFAALQQDGGRRAESRAPPRGGARSPSQPRAERGLPAAGGGRPRPTL